MQRSKIWIILLTVSIADAGTRASSKSPTSENIKSATRYVRYHRSIIPGFHAKAMPKPPVPEADPSRRGMFLQALRRKLSCMDSLAPETASFAQSPVQSDFPYSGRKVQKQNTARHQKSGHLHDPDTKQGNTDTDQQVKQHRIGYDSKFCRTFTAINFLCKNTDAPQPFKFPSFCCFLHVLFLR